MEDRKLSELTEAQAKAEGEKKKSIHFFWWMFGISLGLIYAVFFFVFLAPGEMV